MDAGTKKPKTMNKGKSNTGNGVKAKSDAASDLRELFIHGLKDMYWAENALTKALPKLAKNAHSKKLVKALQDHLAETEGQIDRLEDVFEMIGEKAEGEECAAMAGIIEEGEDIMKETEPGTVRDAGIISAGQKAEHYEIASYGTLVAWAHELNLSEAADLLDEILDQEKAADEKLSELAMEGLNEKAA